MVVGVGSSSNLLVVEFGPRSLILSNVNDLPSVHQGDALVPHASSTGLNRDDYNKQFSEFQMQG